VTAVAVADVIHLITDLTETAARRAAGGEVTIRAGRVGRGLAVEIEDRGADVDAEWLGRVNALLASPPDLDMVEADQLGYVVAARLAAKHQIAVTLRSSPVGGTAAILVLPHAILVTGSDRDTIVDGSLSRIDVSPEQSWPSSPEPEQHETPSPAGLADSRVAPYVAADEDPDAAKPAPWYWLTAGQPATEQPAAAQSWPAPGGSGVPENARSAADQPTEVHAAAGSDTASSGSTTAAGLPRRVRQATFGPAVRSFDPDDADEQRPPAE
jgi:hypothetical protein